MYDAGASAQGTIPTLPPLTMRPRFLVGCMNQTQLLRADMELTLGPGSATSLRRFATSTSTLANLLLNAAEEVRTLLQDIIVACEAHAAAKPEQAAQAEALGDLCFAARLDLRQVTAQLEERRVASSRSDLLVLCERLHRRIQRALGAAAGGLSRVTGIPDTLSPEGRAEEVRTAVAVRTFYRDFWTAMAELERAPAPVMEKLLRVSKELSEWLTSPVSDLARLSDKLTLVNLQQRVELLMNNALPTENPSEVLADVFAAAAMLKQVNQRELLKEHDRELIQNVRALILSQSVIADIVEQLRERLAPLLGRDAALDELIEERGVESVRGGGQLEWLTQLLNRLQELEADLRVRA